jgi:hypothetical protein
MRMRLPATKTEAAHLRALMDDRFPVAPAARCDADGQRGGMVDVRQQPASQGEQASTPAADPSNYGETPHPAKCGRWPMTAFR